MSHEYDLPDFDEASMSQIPALLELVNLGYTYIPRSQVSEMRENNSQYVLREIAFDALRRINGPNISDKSIHDTVFEAEQIEMGGGMFPASEDVYSLMLAGRAVSEIIDGRRVSPQMKFIDFKELRNNRFHVCAEFELSEGHDRRPDIVLFVNGFPFAVIENKKESVKVDEAVAQMVRNQSRNETPKFFLFPQILLATNVRELKYGTMLTQARFYALWKEKDAGQEAYNAEVSALINKPVDHETVKQIASDLIRTEYTQTLDRTVTDQDRGIYSLLRPERLLDLTRNFILYDGGIKKIARYPQYFAIKKAMKRLKTFDDYGRRRGGLIWHTQGTGKSLTMVMLVKCLIDDPDIVLPRVLVVTDRRDLDKQISDTFAACNIKKDVKRTTSAKKLLGLIKEKDQRVITSLIHKFEAARAARDFIDEDPNVFVLIDEAHRTQAGKANIELNLILPKACQIGFTGTPLMKREKSSAKKFGGIIDAYTISEGEADDVVLPLIYQPRFVEQRVQQDLLDRFYDKITRDLSDEQKKDLQRKFSSSQIVEETSQRIESIALDILEHYREFVDTGLKAQVVAPSKYAAVMFMKAFDLQDKIPIEVIISESADKEEDDKLPEHRRLVVEWLANEKHKHGSSLETREKKLIKEFKENPEGVRMLIVVDKLLTGFDAPRNTFLYLAKQLKDHNLLQAIARVNRLFDGDERRETKVNGFVIDYSKNAKNLYDAMELFSNYAPEDIERALLNSDEKIRDLERVYQELHSIFNAVGNKQDTEAYVRVLEDNVETCEHFYELVNEFIKQFSACRMLYDFTQKFDAEKLHRYQGDLKKFVELKKIQKIKNAEAVDFSKYEDQIRRILDKYVTAEYVEELAKPLHIGEPTEFNEYIEDTERGLSDKSKAEAIAAQTRRTIKENYHRDPEFYSRFSDKIKNLIAELKNARKEDLKALLDRAREYQGQVIDYEDSDIPALIKEQKEYHPYFRNLQSKLKEHSVDPDQLCEMVKTMYDLIEQHKIVDWHRNIEVERQVREEIEDYLFDVAKEKYDIPLATDEIDAVITLVWDLAVENRELGIENYE
ncbi:MAG: type I restriction endonuclease subunit R [Proteobacteria bacterium]|nr:type I restriction endonuclease subunit R [Pseudomonadota bacterium]